MTTGELCKIIDDLGGTSSTLTDKTEKTLKKEIIRLLSGGLTAPTAAEVVTAIQAMSAEQITAVKAVLAD